MIPDNNQRVPSYAICDGESTRLGIACKAELGQHSDQSAVRLLSGKAGRQTEAEVMRAVLGHILLAAWIVTCSLRVAYAQDLAPRAYLIGPIHSNAITLTSSFSSGQILLNGVIPVPDSTGTTMTSSATYYHSFNVLGRCANFTAALPDEIGNFTGTVRTDETTVYRSGLAGVALRFSTNLLGGPAMDRPEFLKWRQKSVVGASLLVITPTGRYDPIRLINLGDNRWSFKPEVAYSRRVGNWLLDAYAGAWLFKTNDDYFSRNQYFHGTNVQTQTPIGPFQGHLSYDLGRRFWTSLDGNFWLGGRTSLNGIENPETRERNSRLTWSCSRLCGQDLVDFIAKGNSKIPTEVFKN